MICFLTKIKKTTKTYIFLLSSPLDLHCIFQELFPPDPEKE